MSLWSFEIIARPQKADATTTQFEKKSLKILDSRGMQSSVVLRPLKGEGSVVEDMKMKPADKFLIMQGPIM